MVTYEQLKNGYILQKGDKLILHRLDYEVCFSGDYYLSCTTKSNSYVFDILGMEAKEREDFTRRFNPVRFGEAQGAFPEFNDLKTLTELVIALYEVPEYKIGDWVTILPRDESKDYSPVCYANGMTEYVGKTYKVKRCNIRAETQSCGGVDNGDPHSYDLDGIEYHWTSQMIRKATEEEIRKVDRETSECFNPISEEEVKKIADKMEEIRKSIHPVPNNTSSDTEIRLPNNEEEIPHIKL